MVIGISNHGKADTLGASIIPLANVGVCLHDSVVKISGSRQQHSDQSGKVNP